MMERKDEGIVVVCGVKVEKGLPMRNREVEGIENTVKINKKE